MSLVKVANSAGKFHEREAVPQHSARAQSDSGEDLPWWHSTPERLAEAAARGAKMPEVSPRERALRLLEDERGETSQNGKRFREIFADSSVQEILDRIPARPPAAKLAGDALARARSISDGEVTLARGALERVLSKRAALD